MRLGFGLWRKLFLELRGLIRLLSGSSEFASTSGSLSGYVSVTWLNPSVWKRFENTRVRFLVCSASPQLIKQTSLKYRLNWVALHFYSRRQKLALRSHTPTLWHTTHRVWGSHPDQVYFLVAWFVCQLGVGGLLTGAFAYDEAPASCWCQFCVPDNCC